MLELADSAFPGCPYLGSDIVEHFDPVLVCEFGYLEVESGIVYEDDDIGTVGQDVLLAVTHILQKPASFADYLPESHDCAFLVMTDQPSVSF